MDDGTVFSSMKEFWLWIIVVSLILAMLFVVLLDIVVKPVPLLYTDDRI